MEKLSCSDNSVYPSFCKEAATNENIFKNFRISREITDIIETVSFADGTNYLEYAKKKRHFNELKKYFKEFERNDNIGNPQRFEYLLKRNLFGNQQYMFAPTTLRYINVLSDLVHFFSDLDGKTVIEIGGGYGGLCRIIATYFNIKRYYIVDLPEVNELSKKYLSHFNLDNISTLVMDELSNDVEYDLVISNYAFSEVNGSIQSEYKRKVLDKSKHGYLVINTESHTWDDKMMKLPDYQLINDNVIISKDKNILSPLDISCGISLVTW